MGGEAAAQEQLDGKIAEITESGSRILGGCRLTDKLRLGDLSGLSQISSILVSREAWDSWGPGSIWRKELGSGCPF